MPISGTLFDLKPRSIDDPHELAGKLREALIDTAEVEDERERPLTGRLWLALSEYDRGDSSGEEFMNRVRAPFPD